MPATSTRSPMVIGRSARMTKPLMKLLAMFCRPETDTHSDCASENRQRAEMNSSVLQDNENADYQHDVADDLGNRALERTIESTFSKDSIKKKTLRPRRDPKDGNQKCDQQKNLKKT